MILSNFRRALYEADINQFMEAFWRDSKGNLIKQAEIHKVMQAHIDWCHENGKHCLILAPWGHAKTEQSLGRCLHWIIQDPELRIKIVCETGANAIQRLKTIQRYVESPEFQEIFPDIQPMGSFAKPAQWAGNKLMFQRKSLSKDATIEGFGVESKGTGTRADIIIFDDPVGPSAIDSEADREAVKQAVRNTWMSRTVDDSFILYIATAWHDCDLTSELQENPRFALLKICINDNIDGMDIEWRRTDETHPYWGLESLPLWEEEAGEEYLREKMNEIGLPAFERGYRHRTLIPGALVFPHVRKALVDSIPDVDNWPKFAGVDFAKDSKRGNVIFTLACNNIYGRGAVVVPLNVVRSNLMGPDFARLIAREFVKYDHRIIMIETNGVQLALLEWMRAWDNLPNMPMQDYETGRQKNGWEVGLPSIDVEFQNGIWQIQRPSHDISCNCDYCTWIDSLKKYPQSREDDTIMAMWLAREASRSSVSRVMAKAGGVKRHNWFKVPH